MLEAGTHLHTIQKLLGHKQITSTMVYLHLTSTSLTSGARLTHKRHSRAETTPASPFPTGLVQPRV
jgi:site-specific recombinase XerD